MADTFSAPVSFLVRPSGALRLALAAVLAAAAVAVFYDGLIDLVVELSRREEYSHAYFLPVVSLWLLWMRRDALVTCPASATWWALLPLAVSLLLLTITKATAATFFAQAGFVVCLAAIVLATGGWRMFRLTAIPIAYLLFAIPAPAFATTWLTIGLQLLSSELGVFFIRLFGVPVYLEGNVIDLGQYKLGVAEACAGLTYMFPFLSISFLLAYLVRLGWIERTVIFLSAIPIAIVMNGARIGFIGLIVDRFGIAHVEGFTHYFEGWVVFVFCLAILLGLVVLLAALRRQTLLGVFGVPDIPAPAGGSGTAVGGRPVYGAGPAIATAILLVAGAVGVGMLSSGGSVVPERQRFATMPAVIDGYDYARSYDLEEAVEEVLAADDYIVADFVGGDQRDYNLYIHYFDKKKGRHSWHTPSKCIPGGGWKLVHHDVVRVPAAEGRMIPVNRMFIERSGIRRLVYYWYQQRGRSIASEWTLRYYLILDGLMRSRTDGAMVRLITTIRPDDTDASAELRLQEFAKSVTEPLPAFVPD